MINIYRNRQYVLVSIPWLALGLFMAFTHPAELPVYALLVPFVLLGVALYVTLNSAVGAYFKTKNKHQKNVTLLLTLFLVTCAGLQSVGQLTMRDFITVLLLTLLGYFYLYRNVIASKQ